MTLTLNIMLAIALVLYLGVYIFAAIDTMKGMPRWVQGQQ